MLQQRLTRSLQTIARQSPALRTARQAATTSRAPRFNVAPVASHPLSSRRWYSSSQESDTKKEEAPKGQTGADEAKPEAQTEAKKAAEEDPVKKELEAKKREVVDLTDRVMRSVAEFRNLQEQTKREVKAARDFALQKFAKDLLDSVDNLDRALGTVDKAALNDQNPELVKLHGGLKMTEEIMLSTLKRHGLERFDPSIDGDVFDPNKHEATFQTPMPDKKDGTVFYTESKGFLYNGRTLRQAKVGVVKNS